MREIQFCIISADISQTFQLCKYPACKNNQLILDWWHFYQKTAEPQQIVSNLQQKPQHIELIGIATSNHEE